MIPPPASSTRQYHSTSSAYVLPNEYVFLPSPHVLCSRRRPDEPADVPSVVEHERLDAQAAAIVEMIGGNPFLAPLDGLKVSKAADVGCGTGVATVQLASLLPAAIVHGLDISPVPAGVRAVAPRNVRWAQGNILNVYPGGGDGGDNGPPPAAAPASLEVFEPAGLDYLFGRMLFLGINHWPRYFSVAAAALKPGGVIEHQDLD